MVPRDVDPQTNLREVVAEGGRERPSRRSDRSWPLGLLGERSVLVGGLRPRRPATRPRSRSGRSSARSRSRRRRWRRSGAPVRDRGLHASVRHRSRPPRAKSRVPRAARSPSCAPAPPRRSPRDGWCRRSGRALRSASAAEAQGPGLRRAHVAAVARAVPVVGVHPLQVGGLLTTVARIVSSVMFGAKRRELLEVPPCDVLLDVLPALRAAVCELVGVKADHFQRVPPLGGARRVGDAAADDEQRRIVVGEQPAADSEPDTEQAVDGRARSRRRRRHLAAATGKVGAAVVA